MENIVLIDNRMREFEKSKLVALGYRVIEIPTSDKVYYEISSHVDIFACKVKNDLVIEPSIYENIKNKIDKNLCINVIKGSKSVKNEYPSDVLYNVCITKDYAIGNFKYVDSTLNEVIEKNNLQKVNINQGYSKCSIAVIGENSVIVTDKGIAKILKEKDIDVNVIDFTLDIKLLNSSESFSTMNGFIGGCISRIDDFLFVTGDVDKLDKTGIIGKISKDKKIQIIDFKYKSVIDYGGILKI